MRWYYLRIRKLISDISAASRRALPQQREEISRFICCPEVRLIDDLLSGLVGAGKGDLTWETDEHFSTFKDFVLATEAGMETRLGDVNYDLDETTLKLVAGPGRFEMVCVGAIVVCPATF